MPAGRWRGRGEASPPTIQALAGSSHPERGDPAVVGVVMGSSSDWETLRAAVEILAEFGIAHEAKVVSAHRMPDEMFAYAEGAAARGLRAIIAGAGGAAHLPGMLAAGDNALADALAADRAARHDQAASSTLPPPA